jgi:hypothetical protein
MLFLWWPLGLLYELGIGLCRLAPARHDGPAEEWPQAEEAVGV